MTVTDARPDAELTYTRVFAAPRELVFRCMTEPEHLTHFWGPMGTYAPQETITVDLRPGGVFETVMVSESDGSRYTMHAVFDEVAVPERLVWTEPASGVTTISTFSELSGPRTEVRIVQRNVPEAFHRPEAQAGFRTSLDRFASYLTQQTGART
jgi:uncharacterized protein YndB with AHSA1/START domain